MSREIPRRDSSDFGLLRCMVCGGEKSHVPAGLNYGFPVCCRQKMRVVTRRELQEEREFYERQELEERFIASTEK